MPIEAWLAPLFPAAALRMARARLAYEGLRAYEAAGTGRRLRNWLPGQASADAELLPALGRMRDRSRDLDRNNPYANAGLTGLADFQVGYGIGLRSATGDKAIDAEADRLFTEWSAVADMAGLLDLAGMTHLAARTRARDGEVLALPIRLTAAEMRARNSPVPLAIQLLEADYLDDMKAERLADGGAIRQGVELDPQGRPRAYWLLQDHPGDYFPFARMKLGSDRVAAADVIHLYRVKRPGQTRGEPDLAPVMVRLRSLDEYEDAALEQAKVQACLAAFVTSDAAPGTGPLEGKKETAETGQRKTLAPAIIERLKPGEGVEFLTPSGAGGFSEFARHQLRAISIGLDIPYDILTGDLTQANYSSLRAGRVRFKRAVERDQWTLMVPRFLAPVHAAFIAAAQGAGLLPRRAGAWPVKFAPPPFEMLDPAAEADGLKKMIRAGLKTWPQAVAEQGYDPEQQIREIAETNAKMDAAGVILDGDPRRMSAPGNANDPKQLAKVELTAAGAPAPPAAP
jgi:lambda family phage portal protein